MPMILKVNLNDADSALFEAVANALGSRLPSGLEIKRGSMARQALVRGLEVMAEELNIVRPMVGAAPTEEGDRRHATSNLIVELVHRLYHQNHLAKADIVRHLEKAGYKTARGGRWSISTINRILSRPPDSHSE